MVHELLFIKLRCHIEKGVLILVQGTIRVLQNVCEQCDQLALLTSLFSTSHEEQVYLNIETQNIENT